MDRTPADKIDRVACTVFYVYIHQREPGVRSICAAVHIRRVCFFSLYIIDTKGLVFELCCIACIGSIKVWIVCNE